MAELKPCPFCGGEAHFMVTNNISNHSGVGVEYIIACSKCKCTPISESREMHFYIDKNGEIKMTEASVAVKQIMINMWNRRTPKERG